MRTTALIKLHVTYLHAGPLLSAVANDEKPVVAQNDDLARVPKVADFFPGMAETSEEFTFLVEDLEH